MKVLFDVSILGHAHEAVESRAGIFRVVENIALGLHEADSCDLTLCASQKNFLACRQYLTANPPFEKARFSQPDNLFSTFYDLVEPLRTEIAKLPTRSWKTPLRKVYRYGEQFLKPLHGRDIKNTDIYHSPVHPIPAQINNAPRIAKFITVHDLIPLLCPEHRSPSCIVSMKRIMNSIHPDTFIFAVSESTKNDLLTQMPYLDRSRISVVHLAAGAHFYPCTDSRAVAAVKHKYSIPPEGDYLLALSTLQPRKNFDRTIRSFVSLLREEKIKDLRLVLVGANGWEFKEIYQEVKNAAGFSDKIILTGYVPDEDLAPLYSGALAFVYPSLYEGFGLPPLEAMQCGTPVITSNTSSIPEVVGTAGIMVDPRQGEELSQAMLEIYRSPELRRRLAGLSIARAGEFSWQKATKKTIAAYRQALN